MMIYLVGYLIFCYMISVLCLLDYISKYIKIKEHFLNMKEDYRRSDGSIIQSRLKEYEDRDSNLVLLKKELQNKCFYFIVINPVRIALALPAKILVVIVFIILAYITRLFENILCKLQDVSDYIDTMGVPK